MEKNEAERLLHVYLSFASSRHRVLSDLHWVADRGWEKKRIKIVERMIA